MPIQRALTPRRAHAELIEALWARIAPPATRPLSYPPGSQQRRRAQQATSSPPIAQPLAYVPILTQSSSDDEQLPPPPLPVGGDDDDLELASSTLAAARLVLLSTSMQPALRRRLLQLPCAVLALPPRAAVERDECWRNAASTLCMLSSSKAGISSAESDALDGGGGGGGGGGACASLAAPMLIDATAAVLSRWSCSDGADEIGDASGQRASQIAHLLSLLGSLSLPDGLLPDPGSGAAAPAAAPAAAATKGGTSSRSGRRAHLLRLTPCLIECIGQPAHLYANGPLPPSVSEMAAAVRRLLHMVAGELRLE